jgi:hypothetical protein
MANGKNGIAVRNRLAKTVRPAVALQSIRYRGGSRDKMTTKVSIG